MNTRKIMAAAYIVVGVGVAICCRIKAIDMTEGQALIAFWPQWLVAVLSILTGIRRWPT